MTAILNKYLAIYVIRYVGKKNGAIQYMNHFRYKYSSRGPCCSKMQLNNRFFAMLAYCVILQVIQKRPQ